MPDRKRPDTDPLRPDYRDQASNLHHKADEARFPEARQTFEEVARYYEVLANHVERRRKPRPR